MLRAPFAAAVFVCACSAPELELPPVQPRLCEQGRAEAPLAVTHYHGTASKLGWNDEEAVLSSTEVGRYGLERAWVSARFDESVVDGISYEAISYASPLYADDVLVQTADGDAHASIVLAATNNGWVYAIAGQGSGDSCGLAPGELLWRTSVAEPAPVRRLDGGVPLGVLGTPVLDLEASPPRMYVAAMDAEQGWQITALALYDGRVLGGWPLTIDDRALSRVNRNGPARFWDAEIMSQRGALALSPGGERLYVAFGTFWGEGVGWIASINTAAPYVTASFSSAPWVEPRSNGGIWGSAGPTVDASGRVWLTTGNAPPGSGDSPGVWGSSLLQLDAELELERAYSPFNYCQLDQANMDLGASQPLLLPPLDDTATPNLVAFGGKQGNVYLVDRDTMTEAGPGRGLCGTDASLDRSLLPPEVQPQFGTRGPLNVFGPYSDIYGQIDHAKMRTKLAYWQDASGRSHLFAAGSTKAAPDSTLNVAPSIARLAVVTEPGEPAWLEIEAVNPDVVFHNPGSPIVTSDEGGEAVVWVIDRNAPRTASFLDPETPGPIIYAFDAASLELRWRSKAGELGPIGKYGTPIVVHGQLLLATDRIEAFALGESFQPPERDR